MSWHGSWAAGTAGRENDHRGTADAGRVRPFERVSGTACISHFGAVYDGLGGPEGVAGTIVSRFRARRPPFGHA